VLKTFLLVLTGFPAQRQARPLPSHRAQLPYTRLGILRQRTSTDLHFRAGRVNFLRIYLATNTIWMRPVDALVLGRLNQKILLMDDTPQYMTTMVEAGALYFLE
jgi:hypothetical protein